MIANFYTKRIHSNHFDLLVSKNIEIIPEEGMIMTFNKQTFVVNRVRLDLDKCEYNIEIIKYDPNR